MGARSDSTHDPFPREQALELIKRLPAYAKLALAVGRDEALPGPQRAALIGAGTYVVSPIGLVPGFIPLVGQLDDLWVLLRALRFALDGLSPLTRAEHLAAAGVTEAQLEDDFASVSELVAWTARRGRSATVRAAARGRRVGQSLSQRAERLRAEVQRQWAERSTNQPSE